MEELYFEIDTTEDCIENLGHDFVKNNTSEDKEWIVDEFLQSAFQSMDEKRREMFIEFCKDFHKFKIDFDKKQVA